MPPTPQKPWQRKKAQKGLKSKRGQPEIYDELKTKQTLTLTPTAVKGLDKIAELLGISRSELVERIGRGIIPLAPMQSHSQPIQNGELVGNEEN
ncbi:hypothetical protein H6G14_28655 [Nostoc parmelioides FACHB-3921]|uniref:Ribbon-helix-helix protein CopG domain-containing protein n=1 Tax=Nostoc parmelioides FACHB-3921 TaxID=2692909 RepID=A0ABR8BPF9_9NOSO|nr:hypothetical protein [Nostoc parmelioides FACHB-3921]